jgi:hypothetical protein
VLLERSEEICRAAFRKPEYIKARKAPKSLSLLGCVKLTNFLEESFYEVWSTYAVAIIRIEFVDILWHFFFPTSISRQRQIIGNWLKIYCEAFFIDMATREFQPTAVKLSIIAFVI